MTILDKIKSFFKRAKPAAKMVEQKPVEPVEEKPLEATREKPAKTTEPQKKASKPKATRRKLPKG